jgi:hypothetical protein
MGGIGFIVCLTVGAAVLGVWIDYRLGSRRPESAVRRFVHAGIAFALLQVTTGLGDHVASGQAGKGQRLAAIFLLLLPSLAYAFMAGLWLVRTVAEAARATGR